MIWRQLVELLEHLKKVIPEDVLNVDTSKFLQMGSIYECMGVGLRKQRAKDRQYQWLMKKLNNYRFKVDDKTLNDLIQRHIFISECFSNFMLLEKLPESSKKDLMKILPQENRISWQGGGAETAMNETMWDIRTAINEHIQELSRQRQNDST